MGVIKVKKENNDAFILLAETLIKAGWRIHKFEDMGGAIELTIIPDKQDKDEE